MKIIIIALLFPLNLLAESNGVLIDSHQEISSVLSNTMDTIDRFLGGVRSDNINNDSNFRVYFLSTTKEESKRTDLLRYRLNLRLPRLEKKFRFSIENQTERREIDRPITNSKTNEEQQKTLEKARASVNYDSNLSFWKQSFGVGFRFALPLTSFFTNRLSNTKEYDQFLIRTIFDIFGNSRTGLGETFSIDIDHQITPGWLFRFVNEQAFINLDNQFSTSNGPTLFYYISDNDILSYNFRANGMNQEVYYINEYIFNIVYRRKIYKDYFFFEVTPGRSFEKERNFKEIDSISFRLELLFQKF